MTSQEQDHLFHDSDSKKLSPQLSQNSSLDSSASPKLNDLTSSMGNPRDLEGLALLRQIFPEESTEELRRIHRERVLQSADKNRRRSIVPVSKAEAPQSILGRKIWEEWKKSSQEESMQWKETNLPDDFLRLPTEVAVRRQNQRSRLWEYQLVADLEKQALEQHQRCCRGQAFSGQCYTKLLFRHPKYGLGVTLVEESGWVRVYSIRHNNNDAMAHREGDCENGDTQVDNICPGDIVLGINGNALLESYLVHSNLLRHAVATIKSSPNPVVLHLQRVSLTKSCIMNNNNGQSMLLPPLLHPKSTPSLLDTTIDESFLLDTSLDTGSNPDQNLIHLFAFALASRGLITSVEDQMAVTRMIEQITERAEQWEFSKSFRIDAKSFILRPNYDELGLHQSVFPHSVTTQHFAEGGQDQDFSPSTPPRKAGSTRRAAYPGRRGLSPLRHSDIFIPLMGVRKAMNVRILNTFLDQDRIAYTIWAYDVESGREWYAPIRYFCDFQDLRSAALHLCPSINQCPFPSQGWSIFWHSETSESAAVRESKSQQLEYFLRFLCRQIYTEALYPGVAEVAIHLQSFLGCDSDLQFDNEPGRNGLDNGLLAWHGSVVSGDTYVGQKHDEHQMLLRLRLKKSLQLYSYRLFLLKQVRDLIDQFVNSARVKGPSLKEIESMQALGQHVLKKRAMEELQKIQAVMDHLQDLVLEGCMEDFKAIAAHRIFGAIHKFFEGDKGESYWTRLVRESIREQVEIEVYLPLRSIISRLLVNGWRHEDMAVNFKIQELKKRSQSFFRITKGKGSISNWQTVSSILKNVSSCTLPCKKLSAIVEAAVEISRLYGREHVASNNDVSSSDSPHLGADDFLPIFIFCVVRAEMERPCALRVLLRTLCDHINRNGEVGYYLATFEAAVTHIREIDLSETHEEMFSFLSIPLNGTSFD